MNKAILFLLIIAFLVPAVLFSEDIGLSENQLKAYNQQRFTFDFQSGSTGYIGSTGIMSMSNYRRWVPYQGFNKLSEFEFFKIAGYEKEANEAKVYNASRLGLLIGGLVALLGGEYLVLKSDTDAPGFTTGRVLVSSGGVATLIGAFMYLSNRYPSNIAVSVAEEYNNKLRKEIMKTINY
jgi:hypothetical protein